METRGRTATPKEQRRDKRFLLVVTDKERKKIHEQAARYGESANSYVRRLLYQDWEENE